MQFPNSIKIACSVCLTNKSTLYLRRPSRDETFTHKRHPGPKNSEGASFDSGELSTSSALAALFALALELLGSGDSLLASVVDDVAGSSTANDALIPW